MEQLADEVLLEVMQHLSTEDLLRCRLVCKRIGGLALHPSLWRQRSLKADVDPNLTCAVLRLAPCLESLQVRFPLKGCDHVLWTKCAVQHLKLCTTESECVNDAILVLQRQELLGRLKDLHVAGGWELDADPQMRLYKALAFTSGLEKLSLCFSEPPNDLHLLKKNLKSMTKTALPSFLKAMMYVGDEHEIFLRFIITVHAASLESVSLHPFEPLPPAYLQLLLGLPKLSFLSCPPLPGMEALSTCKTLQCLALVVSQPLAFPTAGAIKLLRKATQLRRVALSHDEGSWSLRDEPCDENFVIGVFAKLVLALASSGKSSVEWLRIHSLGGTQEDCSPLEQALLIALPRLPALKILHSSHSPQLRGVSPAVAVEVLGNLVLG